MRRHLALWLRRLLASSPGVTLAEVIVVTGIMSIGLSLMGSSLFQVLSIQRFWRDDVIATKESRHANSWFAGDALNAQSTDLVDGAPSAPSVSLEWTDETGTLYTVSYYVSGEDLFRDAEGSVITIARRVVSAQYSLSGKVLQFDLDLCGAQGDIERTSLSTYLRMLQ